MDSEITYPISLDFFDEDSVSFLSFSSSEESSVEFRNFV